MKTRKTVQLLIGALFALMLGAEVNAQARTADQVYKEYRSASDFIQLEMDAKMKKGEMPLPSMEPGSFFKKSLDLQSELDKMAAAGDSGGLFYAGILKHENAETMARSRSATDATARLANTAYQEALQLFKRAGEAGSATGYFNVGVMYRNGEGVTKSNLAAVEWFYRAGIAYLKQSDRENALASLEAMQALDQKSALAKKLEVALSKGAPK